MNSGGDVGQLKKRSINRTVLVTAAALAAAAATVGGVRRHAAEAAAAQAPATAPATASACVAGQQRRWDLTLDIRLGGAANGSPTDATTLTGEWVETVSGSSATGYDLACELEHPRLLGKRSDVSDASQAAQLASRLSRRFWISYGRDGAATRAHFPVEMSDDMRNLLELVATTAQLVRPAEPAPQWLATERDGAGAYLASYAQLAERTIVKRKLRYTSLDGVSGGMDGLRLAIDASEITLNVDPQGQLISLQSHEANHLDAKVGALNLAMDVHLNLDHPRSARAPELIASLERAEPELASGPIVTQHPSAQVLLARSDAHAIEGTTLTSLLDALSEQASDPKTRARLESMLRLRPSEIPQALAFARRHAGTDAARSMLEALGSAATTEAQAALTELVADGADGATAQALRKDAMVALVLTKQPNEATMQAFLSLTNAVGNELAQRQVLFTAGTIARNGAEAHPDQAAQIVAALSTRYATCNAEACLVLISALGNVGTPQVLPVLETALRDPAAERRAAAVDALRLIRDPATDALIAARITDDEDPKVRAAAIGTARYRPIDPLIEALTHTITADPVDFVRVQALNVLTEQLDHSPLIRQAFVAAADNDPKPNVRRLVREALAVKAKLPAKL